MDASSVVALGPSVDWRAGRDVIGDSRTVWALFGCNQRDNSRYWRLGCAVARLRGCAVADFRTNHDGESHAAFWLTYLRRLQQLLGCQRPHPSSCNAHNAPAQAGNVATLLATILSYPLFVETSIAALRRELRLLRQLEGYRRRDRRLGQAQTRGRYVLLVRPKGVEG
jgi:hypothetical protein